MENHNFQLVNQLFPWPCSIAMFVYQRVYHNSEKAHQRPGWFSHGHLPVNPSFGWILIIPTIIPLLNGSNFKPHKITSMISPLQLPIFSGGVSEYLLAASSTQKSLKGSERCLSPAKDRSWAGEWWWVPHVQFGLIHSLVMICFLSLLLYHAKCIICIISPWSSPSTLLWLS